MNDKQENGLSMARVVSQLMAENPTLLSAAASKSVTELNKCITGIDSYTQAQVKQTTGAGRDKQEHKIAALNAAMALLGPANSYAIASKNYILAAALNYSKTDLSRLRDTTLSNTLTLIADTIDGELANLADYEIVAANITALRALIKAYDESVPQPKLAAAKRAAATKALDPLFLELATLLGQLDGLMEPKKNSSPDFFNKYTSSRLISDKRKKTISPPKAVA